MPITARDLRPGDLLFKHASAAAISKLIRIKQGKMFDKISRAIGGVTSVTRSDASDITHMAVAVGPDDVVEFDEGGAGAKIFFSSGYGFIRGDMTPPSRKGNRYEVFRCLDDGLAATAADKALMVYDLAFSRTGGGPRGFASYGVGKLAKFGLTGKGGGGTRNLQDFEREYAGWVEEAARGKKPKVKFICSEFAAYCYCWALLEHSRNYEGVPWLMGIEKAITSPVEYYTRINELGQGLFAFRGTMYT